VRAEVLEVLKNRVKLSIEAWDNQDKIGEGTHLRAVVDKERFMTGVLTKSK
jgi:predicted thioesterase